MLLTSVARTFPLLTYEERCERNVFWPPRPSFIASLTQDQFLFSIIFDFKCGLWPDYETIRFPVGKLGTIKYS